MSGFKRIGAVVLIAALLICGGCTSLDTNGFGRKLKSLNREEQKKVLQYVEYAKAQMQKDWDENCSEQQGYHGTGYLEILHTTVYLVSDTAAKEVDGLEGIEAVVVFTTLADYYGLEETKEPLMVPGAIGSYICNHNGDVRSTSGADYMLKLMMRSYRSPIVDGVTAVNLGAKYNQVMMANEI